MIVKIIDGNSISVKSEEPDDMVALRRAISVGDRIAGSTSREIKKERESIRPEKGQRVRISKENHTWIQLNRKSSFNARLSPATSPSENIIVSTAPRVHA